MALNVNKQFIKETYDEMGFIIYSLIGGVIAGLIIDYTKIPSLVTLFLGLILLGMDFGATGILREILEGIGYALTTLGVYDIIKNKIIVNSS